MVLDLDQTWRDPSVAVAAMASTPRDAAARYDQSRVDAAVRSAAAALRWSTTESALGNVVRPGDKVVIKPNFVIHANAGPWGIEPLLTHASVIRATAEAALEAGAQRVTIGDAPIQSCDFDALLEATGLLPWAEDLRRRDSRFTGIEDYRRTKCAVDDGVRTAFEDLRPLEDFVLYDLGRDSLLEPITRPDHRFRVTQYDPRLMARTHAPGRHRYLVARAIVEADVVINLPKLKTHKKAGITCALKNLIGVNGNKEYLPHHRVGGAGSGGDCYPGRSRTRRTLERVLDRQNSASSLVAAQFWNSMTRALHFSARLRGERLDVEGSWHGNDTIWRTCLDLNRIVLYGQLDGSMANAPRRRILHLVDAIVAGHGDGPLSAQPLPLGLLLATGNAAAADRVGSILLGYTPQSIAITREAFGDFRWPITPFNAEAVRLVGDFEGSDLSALSAVRASAGAIEYPQGWRAVVEAA